MLKNDRKKAKKWQLYLLLIVIILTIILKLYYSYYWPKAKIEINGQEISVLVADNILRWEKGLGDRKELGADGMLFIFPKTESHIFVMRDMRFPIDIIWIKQGMIVDIASNVMTEPTKKEAELTPYIARDDSNWVLEMSAGGAQNLNLKIGDKVKMVRY